MNDGEVAFVAWSDYVGITRCRGVPAPASDGVMRNGIGWAVAGQALTPFDDIAPNPWGPMLEVRQVPVPETHTRIDIWPGAPALNLYLSDARTPDGQDWDCCTRGFMRSALDDLRTETGLDVVAAFEHEFTVTEGLGHGEPPFSLAAMRGITDLSTDFLRALAAAGVEQESMEPEYGVGQFEITTAPAVGAAAGDRAIITREVIREVLHRRGMRATFSPKPTPTSVGNGAHLHFSLRDADGNNASYDPQGVAGASLVAQHFIAGVVRHMPALTALVAPSPVSYYRLGPHHWSCGFASFGIQNRETAIRICPSADHDPDKRARTFNMEFRPPDATASPYMVIGSLVRAGLEGIRRELPLPPAIDRDPADLTEVERAAYGIVPLPSTLPAALEAFERDEAACSWLSPTMRESYVAVKRAEIELAEGTTREELCRMYSAAY